MLDFQNISVHYGLQDVLADVSFRVNASERIGVVGPNGSGKSTLFKIILGEMSTDKGELVIECDPRIGWTRQNPEPDTPDETLLEYSPQNSKSSEKPLILNSAANTGPSVSPRL